MGLSAEQWAVLAAVMGALTGTITYLFKLFISDKSTEIARLRDEADYWRDVVMGIATINGQTLPDFMTWYQGHHSAEPWYQERQPDPDMPKHRQPRPPKS